MAAIPAREEQGGDMGQLKRICAATDLSAAARHAAERASLVSKQAAASVDLLHIANLRPLERLRQIVGLTSADLEQRVIAELEQKLHELASHLEHRHGVAAGTHVLVGSVLTELPKEVETLSADLLVCGAKGESFFRHLVLGTTALRILSKSSCPVLVVKQPPHEPYRRVLVPVDFSPDALRAVKLARSVAPQAEITLLNVFEVPFEGMFRHSGVEDATIQQYRLAARQDAIHRLHSFCDKAGLPPGQAGPVVRHGDPAFRIIEYAHEYDCDLIVMGKHGHDVIDELLLGSTTKRVLAESQSDVLISV